MSTLKCIIFDMDGTLTHTNRLIFDAFNYIARKYVGRDYTPAEITGFFGPPEEGALVQITGPEKIDVAMKEYLAFYREHHNALAELVPGITEVLKFLKSRGVRVGLFTGKGTHTTAITLELFGMTSYFDIVVTGIDFVNHKPSGEGIVKIANHCGLRPEEVLMVGDSPGDVKASREAGSKMAVVAWDPYVREKVLEMETDYRFRTVNEFMDWARREFA